MNDEIDAMRNLLDQIADEAAAMIPELARLVPPQDELWPHVSKLGTQACRIASTCEQLQALLANARPDVHQSLFDEVEAVAAQRGMSLAELMRFQMRLFVEQHRKAEEPRQRSRKEAVHTQDPQRPTGHRIYSRRQRPVLKRYT
jgi:hypothetical protein